MSVEIEHRKERDMVPDMVKGLEEVLVLARAGKLHHLAIFWEELTSNKTHGNCYLCTSDHHEVGILRDLAQTLGEQLFQALVRAGALPELKPPEPPKSEVN